MRTANKIFAILLSGSLALGASAGFAHDGHGVLPLTADAQDVSVVGQQVTMTVSLQAYEGHVPELLDVFAYDLESVRFQQIFGGDAAQGTYVVHLDFTAPVPGIFTAVLDFGEAGQAPLLVIP